MSYPPGYSDGRAPPPAYNDHPGRYDPHGYGSSQPGGHNQPYGYGPPQGMSSYPVQPGAPPSAYGAPRSYGPAAPLPPKNDMPPAGASSQHYQSTGQKPVVIPAQTSGLAQSTKGLFSSLRKEWNSAVNTFDKYTHSGVAAAEYFRQGNVVQLISRNSGRVVQIVQGPSGMLTVDANGLEGPNTFNGVWTVAACFNYTIQIHNNFNYLAIENGSVVLKYYPHPHIGGPETKFRLISVDGQFIYLECDYDQKFHVGFENNGLLKSAIVTGRDTSSQFAVRLISGVPRQN